MRKETKLWPVKLLRANCSRITFPVYQREPNVWGRDAKQRLIDSIARQFDIASLYFYVNDDGSWDCVDGRQRIGAIMSFLQQNPGDDHDGFEYRVLNEVFLELSNSRLDGMRWRDIEELSKKEEDENAPEAKHFVESVLDYELTVTMLHDSAAPAEFNLQFARLNLGTIINSGEKLNAMVGDLRDMCFDDLAGHKFLQSAAIPTRRFASEQLAAQIVAQVFAIEEGKTKGTLEFVRTRHNDLQKLFKDHTRLGADRLAQIERARRTMDLLAGQLGSFPQLRSRAIVLSAVSAGVRVGHRNGGTSACTRDVRRRVRGVSGMANTEGFRHRLGVPLSGGVSAAPDAGVGGEARCAATGGTAEGGLRLLGENQQAPWRRGIRGGASRFGPGGAEAQLTPGRLVVRPCWRCTEGPRRTLTR